VRDLTADIMDEIRRILSAELEKPGPVALDHQLAGDLEIDSVGAVVLAVGLEDRFRVKLSGEDTSAVVTVRDLVEMVERRLRARDGDESGDSGRGGAAL